MAKAIQAEAVKTLAAGSLTASYVDVGAVTANPARLIMLDNSTDTDVTVSWDDGTTDVFDMPAGTQIVLDFTANGRNIDDGMFLASGSQFQAKHQGSGGTSGKVIINVFY